MISMTIKAPETYNEETKQVEDRKDLITISLDGDTYQVKDQIKAHGFQWDGDLNQWYYTTDRAWFKANSYGFVRTIAKQFKCRPNIIGEQAKIAIQTMDK